MTWWRVLGVVSDSQGVWVWQTSVWEGDFLGDEDDDDDENTPTKLCRPGRSILL